MRAASVVLMVAMAAAGVGRSAAQESPTADSLRRAEDFYERLDVERALPLLRQIVAPTWPFAVTGAQRVEAYKVLGAALALTGVRDSAVFFFQAAIQRDPLTDLDPLRFTPAQLEAFHEARRRTFAVAVQPVAAARIDPRTERATFSVLTTHAGSLRVELRPPDGGKRVVLFDGETDGVRELRWDGLATDGRLAPPGRYELVALGRSRTLARADSSRVYFDLSFDRPGLEDTLPSLGPRDLLPERYTGTVARTDLFKAVGVAGAALVLSRAVTNGKLGRDQAVLSVTVFGAALATGIFAVVAHHGHADIPANVQRNVERQTQQAAANDAIRRRNAEKIAQTILLIAPAAGVAP